jgi:ABC-2 type transport system permease protein
VLVLLLAGRIFYNLVLPVSPFPMFIAYLISYISFIALGFALAGIVPTARTAQAVGMAVFFPMLFLSGAAMPRAAFPETVQRVSDFLPLTHITLLIEGLWIGTDWRLLSLSVLLGVLVVAGALSLRVFRWE